MTTSVSPPGAASVHDEALLMSLMRADSEAEVISTLRSAGYWDEPTVWRYYGDDEGNYRIGGNQTGRSEPALVEKVVNSIDAMLMRHCLEAGTNPRSADAPQSIRDAVSRYYEYGRTGSYHGNFANWTDTEIRNAARDITVALTGNTPSSRVGRGYPSITIADRGEGQTPDALPETILSLRKGLKSEVPFVQGKFNMGGTAALRFAGENNLQLIVSKRSPSLTAQEGGSTDWGFTVVRLETFEGSRMSTYRYLAPVNASTSPNHGDILRVARRTLPIFPERNDAYAVDSEWGTLVKLYEYETRFRTSFFQRGGLLAPLDVFLPGLPLPVRLHECRGFRGHSGSFETTLTGLRVRLSGVEQELEPIEDDFSVDGRRIAYTVFCTKNGAGRNYRGDDAIIFSVNGQTHATLSERFFRRARVAMGPLQKDLVVVLDCSGLDTRSLEKLFLNSRDRLADSELRRRLEEQLATVLGAHPALRELRERRLREDVMERLSDQKPLKDALQSIFKHSPTLSRMFISGEHLSNPFDTRPVGPTRQFEGNRTPTFFRFRGRPYGLELSRDCHLGERPRLDLETDAEDGYFGRAEDRGVLSIVATVGERRVSIDWNKNLRDGQAHVNITLPDDLVAGDTLRLEVSVTDPDLADPFVNVALLDVRPARATVSGSPSKPREPSGNGGDDRLGPTGIAIPEIIPVRRQDWGTRDMDEYSALRIERSDADGPFNFYVNMDNLFLQHEHKGAPETVALNEARFATGLVLLGLGLIRQKISESKRTASTQIEQDPDIEIEELVAFASDGFAPMLLPALEALSGIDPSVILTDERTATDTSEDPE